MLTRETFTGPWAGLPVAWTDDDRFDEPTYRADVARSCEAGNAARSWRRLNVPPTGYYPRSVQAPDGRIYIFAHVGDDNAYGSVGQSIIMDTFRLETP